MEGKKRVSRLPLLAYSSPNSPWKGPPPVPTSASLFCLLKEHLGRRREDDDDDNLFFPSLRRTPFTFDAKNGLRRRN